MWLITLRKSISHADVLLCSMNYFRKMFLLLIINLITICILFAGIYNGNILFSVWCEGQVQGLIHFLSFLSHPRIILPRLYFWPSIFWMYLQCTSLNFWGIKEIFLCFHIYTLYLCFSYIQNVYWFRMQLFRLTGRHFKLSYFLNGWDISFSFVKETCLIFFDNYGQKGQLYSFVYVLPI